MSHGNHDYRKQNKLGMPAGERGSVSGCLKINPERIRAIGTGIGQAATAAVETGFSRARRVSECIPAEQRKVLSTASGYPAEGSYPPVPTLSGPPRPDPYIVMPVNSVRQTKLK